MRIKVDFSEFFDDERKLSVVNVNTEEAASVKDVLHKIIRMFKLLPTPHKRKRGGGDTSNEKLEFGLFEEGFYIPPEETSTVLQDIGILKLKPLTNVNEENITSKKKKQRAQKKEEDGEEEQFLESDDENTVRKRRRSKRHKEEEEEVTKEGRKSKRHKEEEEETTKEGRKSKRYKDEEEENTKERRKSKRHAVDAEENIRERKGRRRKDSVESDEEEEDAENIDNYKKGKRLSGKKSKFIAQTSDAESSAESSNAEESKKSKRKGRHPSESESEIEEERKIKRKHKREAIRDTTSVTLIEKVEDVPLKEKKKSKKDKAKQEEEDLSETDDMKKTRIESASVPETKRRKGTRQSLVEVNEASAIHDSGNVDKSEEKRSQEKEITTTNVIHVESDEASESSFSSDGSSEEMMDIGSKVDEQGSVDSIPVSSITTNETCMLGIPEAKKRRRRKHSKGKKKHPQSEVEARYPCQSYAAKTSHNANVPSGQLERECRPIKFQHKNSDVSTSSMRSHVCFKSDDEGEVTSVSNSGDGNEIEIVGIAPGPANKRHSDTGTPLLDRGLNAQINNQRISSEYDLGQSFRQSTPRQKNNLAVIEIEGDDAGSSNFQNTDLCRPMCGSTSDCTPKKFVQRSRNANFDSLATLRRMCENKTITIVNVNTTRSKTVNSRPARIPSPVAHMRRGPPLPTFQSSNDISEAARNTFYNLLRLENRAVPLVVRTSRETMVESIEDIDDSDSDVSSEHGNSVVGKPDSHEIGNKEVPVQVSSSPVIQNVSQGETDKDSYELLSIPSTSGSTESCNTSADKPGPSTKISRRVAPRSFHSIGTMLSSLKKPQDSCEETEKLQMVSNDDDEIEAIPLSPVEIKQEEKDPECSKSDGKEKDTECSKSDGEEKDTACSKSDGEEKDIAMSKSDGEDKDTVCSKSDGDITSTKREVITPDEVVFAELLNIQNEKEEEQEEAKPISPIEPVPFVSKTDPLSPTAPYDMEESTKLMKEMITETLKEDLLKDFKVECDKKDDSRFLKFPVMKTLPKVGEYIAVKILSLDEKLRPVYSNYIQVQVLEVSGLNIKFKTVSNIKKHEDMKKVKYEDGVEEVDLTFEEEVDLTQDEQGEIMELDWRDIHEPRLLFP